MNGGALAACQRIKREFGILHEELAKQLQAKEDYACFQRQEETSSIMKPSTEERAESLCRVAMRSPNIYIARRSDRYIVESPSETADQLIALALQALSQDK
jgi:hypothetical protein